MFLAGHMPGRYGLAAVRGNVFAARDSIALIRRRANFGCTTYATVSAAVSRTKLRGFLRSAQSSPGHPILQSTTDRALGSQAGPSKPNDCRSGDRQSNPDLHDKVSRREAQVCDVPAWVAVLIRPTACATQAGSCQKESRSAMWQKRLSVLHGLDSIQSLKCGVLTRLCSIFFFLLFPTLFATADLWQFFNLLGGEELLQGFDNLATHFGVLFLNVFHLGFLFVR